jgi:bacterioferritin-associated ferredoxin
MGRDATRDRLICRCREVTEADVLEAIRDGARSVRGVKVRTRAGTGLCQGQTCGPIIESILKRELGASLAPDDRPTRGPVRAIPVDVLSGGPRPVRSSPIGREGGG